MTPVIPQAAVATNNAFLSRLFPPSRWVHHPGASLEFITFGNGNATSGVGDDVPPKNDRISGDDLSPAGGGLWNSSPCSDGRISSAAAIATINGKNAAIAATTLIGIIVIADSSTAKRTAAGFASLLLLARLCLHYYNAEKAEKLVN